MDRGGFKKHGNTEVFKDWVNGAEVERLRSYPDDWVRIITPSWHESEVYRTYNKWRDSDVEKHYKNGGKVEYKSFLFGWTHIETPSFVSHKEYRIKKEPKIELVSIVLTKTDGTKEEYPLKSTSDLGEESVKTILAKYPNR